MLLRPQAGFLFITACYLVMHTFAGPLKRGTDSDPDPDSDSDDHEFKLELTQTVPETVEGMEKFHWKNTVNNIGDGPVIVLLSPYSVLYHKPLKIYDFTPASGQKKPKYDGWMLKFSFSEYLKEMQNPVEQAAKGKKVKGSAGASKQFILLKKDEEYSVTHELETAWDFTPSGDGTYKAELMDIATYAWVYDGNAPTTAKNVKMSMSKKEHTVKITGKLKNEDKLLVNTQKEKNSKRDAPNSKFHSNCDAAMKKAINGALSHANDYVKETKKFLEGMDLKKNYNKHNRVQQRFAWWFAGWNTHDAHKTVLEVYDKLSKLDYEKDYSFNCEDYQEIQYGAAIPSDNAMTIYPGALFFDAACQNTGADSRAGTFIHEATHFNVIKGTDDYNDPDKPSRSCYGQKCCHRLALRNQVQAIDNADNYEYIAENDPKRPET